MERDARNDGRICRPRCNSQETVAASGQATTGRKLVPLTMVNCMIHQYSRGRGGAGIARNNGFEVGECPMCGGQGRKGSTLCRD